MEYRRLGKSGLKLSLLSFGSWVTFGKQVDTRNAINMMGIAYDAGVNFFDNAEVYENGESEKVMGRVLQELNFPRDSFCLSSKVFWGGEKPTQCGLSAKHVYDACHAALKRLRVDYLDLYFCHRPDPETPIEETVRAMHNLILQGKILYWGTSEWSAAQIEEAYGVAAAHGLTPPTMEQPQYNLFERQKVDHDYTRLFKERGLGTTIWSPLASGMLSGKYSNGIPKDARVNLPGYEWLRERFASPEFLVRIEKVKELEKIAKAIDVTVAQMSIAWCAKNPNVSTVILGASKEDQLEENLKGIEALKKLTPEVMQKIESVVANRPKPL